ncbi:hypothetical protein BKA70DRAFT_1436160 [Coprinopsis sp. MPI-PUGE-AT-0042]|nr:hypothetical protein BKA70DRAFT_1436160 [Coprinopsis sp. MPI-PUGE-AT-0042]
MPPSRDTMRQKGPPTHNPLDADPRTNLQELPTSRAACTPLKTGQGGRGDTQYEVEEVEDDEDDEEEEGAEYEGDSSSHCEVLEIYQPQVNTADVESYRHHATHLGQQLADTQFEVEETAYHLGCLVLQSIEVVKHLAAMRTRQTSIQAALNNFMNHAYAEGISLEYPPIDREMRQRRTHRRPANHFPYNHSPANPTWEDHSRARRLGMDFSIDPTIIAPALDRIWSAQTV